MHNALLLQIRGKWEMDPRLIPEHGLCTFTYFSGPTETNEPNRHERHHKYAKFGLCAIDRAQQAYDAATKQVPVQAYTHNGILHFTAPFDPTRYVDTS